MKITQGKVVSVLVYMEKRKNRILVGELTYNAKDKTYIFQYDKKYLEAKQVPLGADLPLTRKPFISKQLFECFVDRLPSRDDPAYKEHCASEGVDVNESDPFTLLTTFGKRAPSFFVFERGDKQSIEAKDVKAFRQHLQLTIKEFAQGFAISEKTLTSIEEGLSEEPSVMQRIELYIQFPSVALFEFQRNCAEIQKEKQRLVEQVLAQRVREGVRKFQVDLSQTKKKSQKK